jgi:Putative Flp pilus-assembly TadE/G-like
MTGMKNERGQAFVVTVASMLVLLGMAALVLDVGAWFHDKRELQATADAAALAGAQALPERPSDATTLAVTYAGKNGGGVAAGDVTISTTKYGNDTITVKSHKTDTGIFSHVLGVINVGIGAGATATKGSYTGWAKGLAPWVIDKQSVVFGQMITFKVTAGDQASAGNFGGVDLPVQEKGCASGSGGNDYYDLIAQRLHSCIVNTGGQLLVEPGNKAATGTAVKDRGAKQNFDPNSILTTYANGSTEITNYDSPNVIVIPIIQAFHQGSSNPFKVTGFAWFIITSYTSKEVTGMFVRSGAPSSANCATASSPTAACPIGGYNPDGFAKVYLIK